MDNYTITKKQIAVLSNTSIEAFHYLNEEFPDAFKTELETGKWYITDGNKCGQDGKTLIANFSGKEEEANYGITFSGIWGKDLTLYHNDLGRSTRLATPEEVETALINEAKKKGYAGKNIVMIEGALSGKASSEVMGNDFEFYSDLNKLQAISKGCDYTIFKDGKWAEILTQEKTVVPMEKALKILAKKLKVSPENIEIEA